MSKVLNITKSLIFNKYKKNIFISNIHYTNVLSLIFLRNLNNLKIVLVERTPIMELSIYFGFIDFVKKNIIKLLIYLLYNLSDVIVCNSTSISKHFKNKYKLNTKTIFPPSIINSFQSSKKIYEKNKKFSPLKSNFFFNIKNKNELKIFLKKNLFDDEMVICMGAGSISNWIREIGTELQ